MLLLSRDEAYPILNKFVAAEVTTTIRGIPIEVPLGVCDELPKPCVANCDNLRTISKANLMGRIGELPPERLREVKVAVGYAFGWEELIEAR